MGKQNSRSSEYGHTAGEVTTGPGSGISCRYIWQKPIWLQIQQTVILLILYIRSVRRLLSMEGISSEAASLAGTQTGQAQYFDSNSITIEGSTDLAFTENVGKRFEAYGWQVLKVEDDDIDAIEAAILEAKKETGKPTS